MPRDTQRMLGSSARKPKRERNKSPWFFASVASPPRHLAEQGKRLSISGSYLVFRKGMRNRVHAVCTPKSEAETELAQADGTRPQRSFIVLNQVP
eukprot:CAMPEP_0185212822 /NCGR_PEP_ID=MMETSP1140-20130426/67724_1 /TAXON_ID=298111 /ORGANISM="Pavlova sp., Strain CCMP459" /LENGTH=94 /DNA_ID=CAMNT_0027780681 /DNA_START=58 /DNA_END=342 /DNA_ORIENTATION=+